MPVKRRAGKARKQLDSEELDDHFHGPGSALINGCGYCGQFASSDHWNQLSPEEQATVVAAMRADWERCRAQIMDAWDNRTEHERWCSEHHHGNPDRPWSQREFEPAA
ncbi:hypothetical protein ACPVPU_12620 [Sphingomonas sp. CJ99]